MTTRIICDCCGQPTGSPQIQLFPIKRVGESVFQAPRVDFCSEACLIDYLNTMKKRERDGA